MGLSVEPQRLNWSKKTYKVSPNKGNGLPVAARKHRSKRFRAVSELKNEGRESKTR